MKNLLSYLPGMLRCAAVLMVAWFGTVLSATLKAGPTELIYNNINTTDFGYDMPGSTVKINDTELYYWIENGEYNFKKFRGTLTDPFKTVVWSGYSGRWTFPTGYPTSETTRYRPWLSNIYKVNETEYIGIIHVETAFYNDYAHITFVQGIGYSNDAGDHWYYCGDAVRPQSQPMNPGGCALLIVGEYLYQYFNDKHPETGVTHGVARAKISEVVTAARQHSVSPWYKYYNGTWTEPGMNGRSSSVINNYDLHVDAVYCAPLGKYIMAIWNGGNGILYTTSTDGLSWETPTPLFTGLPGGVSPYPFFAGIEGASNDCNVVGSSFCMFFPDRVNMKVYRIPFTVIDDNMVSKPVINPNGGGFVDSMTVALTCGTSGASMRYTTNGSDPGNTSSLYTGSFTVKNTTTIKAKAFKSGMTDSPMASAVFTRKAPYSGTPVTIPGKIEAEDFDNGGELVAYHDLTAVNVGNQYRASEGVDIESIPDGGYNVGYAGVGEWLEFTVNVATAGNYDIDCRMANAGSGGSFHIEFGGMNKTGSIEVPNTGSWTTYQVVTKHTVALSAGQQIMRVVFDVSSIAGSDGVGNLDYVNFVKSPSTAITPLASGSKTGFFAQVGPNPMRNRVNFNVPENSGANMLVEIFDRNGLVVYSASVLRTSGGTMTWDGTDMAGRPAHSGVYYYTVLMGNKATTGRIMKLE